MLIPEYLTSVLATSALGNQFPPSFVAENAHTALAGEVEGAAPLTHVDSFDLSLKTFCDRCSEQVHISSHFVD